MKLMKFIITSGKTGAVATSSSDIPVNSVMMAGIGLGDLTKDQKDPSSIIVESGAKIWAANSIT